ncbi:MAG: alpha/beta hydrolase [Desulfobacterales bacterium]|nr:alpha/beta hydrolase [Desulfobacterales bacterium]
MECITLRIQQKDINIAVQVAGQHHARPMVLLHGFPSNRHLWRHCIPPLAEDYRIYAPDLPGYGDSDKPRGVRYDATFYVHFLEALRRALNLDRFILVAHDVGGMAALAYAVHHPATLSHLVVMDTTAYADWPRLLQIMVKKARTRWGAFWFTRRHVFRRVSQQYLVHRAEVFSSPRAERYRQPWVRDTAGRRAFRQALLPEPEEWAVPPEAIRRLSVPTLVLWAAEDRIIPLTIGRRLSEDIPGARLALIPDCGHFLQEEKPTAVTDHIRAFIEDDRATAPRDQAGHSSAHRMNAETIDGGQRR